MCFIGACRWRLTPFPCVSFCTIVELWCRPHRPHDSLRLVNSSEIRWALLHLDYLGSYMSPHFLISHVKLFSGLPTINLLRGIPCSLDMKSAGCPSPPSYVPRFLTKYSHVMNFKERTVNTLVSRFSWMSMNKGGRVLRHTKHKYFLFQLFYRNILVILRCLQWDALLHIPPSTPPLHAECNALTSNHNTSHVKWNLWLLKTLVSVLLHFTLQ